MKHYLKAFKQYATFSGRAGIKEFWFFWLGNFVISLVLQFIGSATSISIFMILASLWSLITLVPSLAVGVRRMYDIGKDWWYILIPFYNLYLAIQPSEKGPNAHGPEPVES